MTKPARSPKRKPKPRPRRQEERPAPVARGSTLVLANFAKIVGIGLAINEIAIRSDIRQEALAFCVILVMGAQVVEDVVLHAIDRLFSTGADPANEEYSGEKE